MPELHEVGPLTLPQPREVFSPEAAKREYRYMTEVERRAYSEMVADWKPAEDFSGQAASLAIEMIRAWRVARAQRLARERSAA